MNNIIACPGGCGGGCLGGPCTCDRGPTSIIDILTGNNDRKERKRERERQREAERRERERQEENERRQERERQRERQREAERQERRRREEEERRQERERQQEWQREVEREERRRQEEQRQERERQREADRREAERTLDEYNTKIKERERNNQQEAERRELRRQRESEERPRQNNSIQDHYQSRSEQQNHAYYLAFLIIFTIYATLSLLFQIITSILSLLISIVVFSAQCLFYILAFSITSLFNLFYYLIVYPIGLLYHLIAASVVLLTNTMYYLISSLFIYVYNVIGYLFYAAITLTNTVVPVVVVFSILYLIDSKYGLLTNIRQFSTTIASFIYNLYMGESKESRIVKEFDAIIHKHDDTSDNYLRSLESASQRLKALMNVSENKYKSTDIENRYVLGVLRRDRYLLTRQCEDSNISDSNDLKRSIANFLKNEIQIYTSLRFDCGYLSKQLSIVENEILQSVLQNHMDADKENLVDLKNCAFKVARVLEDNIIQSTANYHSTI